ncbi:MAG: citrate lyase acyl carrier protein [Candidatus Coatesbacteria bacterium]|nr:citrate lyase acyl carrier protein [Candidatus Coatesbacteria bacterium]
MEISKVAQAGTLESSDVLIQIEPSDDLTIEIASSVEILYGDKIRKQIKSIIEREGIKNGIFRIQDNGSLPCILEARLLTALSRSMKGD